MKDYFKYCDAFIILTRQGVVLASDDAHLTFEEDKQLHELNQRLIERKKKTWERIKQEAKMDLG